MTYAQDMTSWITPELLAQHLVIPYHLMPEGFMSFVMNNSPEGVDLYEMGKQLQWHSVDGHKIPWKTEYEIAAGYWQWRKQEAEATGRPMSVSSIAGASSIVSR
jgi:hypothetical protein